MCAASDYFRYGGDLPALLRDYGGVAGGVLEVDEHGALDKWICFNGRLRDPCDGVALASRVPLPLASLYLHFEDAGELKRALDGDPALRAALGGAGDGPVFLKATRPGEGAWARAGGQAHRHWAQQWQNAAAATRAPQRRLSL